jgi:UDP-N-acetylglucosamine/UDP-N-acetyl-alpha-D-glucosaminouronate 4-epimerase
MYLVTGGAGFIGSNIVHALLKQGASVRVLDDLSTGNRENLAGLDGAIDLIVGDLRNPDTVKNAMRGVRNVLHHGALPSVPVSIADPISTNSVNISGTVNVLVAARDAGVEKVVYASSCSVYGDDPSIPKQEQSSTFPLSPYALHKLTGEHYCRQFFELFGLETVSLRYFNVYGARQDPQGPYAAVIPKFLEAALDGRKPLIFGDGTQTRDFVFVDDVVRANLAALEAPEAAGKVFNVASGQERSLNDLLAALGSVLGMEIVPEKTPARDGDIHRSVASIDRAKNVLGFEARISLEQGLEKFVSWFRRKFDR